jgi:hypothetical protein
MLVLAVVPDSDDHEIFYDNADANAAMANALREEQPT